MFPSGPAGGAPGRADFLPRWDRETLQRNYQRGPQGPPLLEDDEPSPDAQEISTMSLGQCGRDMQGRTFQLLGWEGSLKLRPDGSRVPELLLMRAFDDDVIFALPGAKRETLLRDTVSYPVLAEDTLADYAVRSGRGGWEGGLWLMSERGYWDMRVLDEGTTYTQIGPWVLEDGERRQITNHQIPSRARSTLERISDDAETVRVIESWKQRLEEGSLLPPENEEERLQEAGRKYLIGQKNNFPELLLRAEGADPERDVLLQVIRESLGRLGDTWGPREVAHIWRMVAKL